MISRFTAASCALSALAALTVIGAGQSAHAQDAVLPPGPETVAESVDVGSLSPELLALLEQHVPGLKPTAAERKERDGRVYWDVEGATADGGEVELDILDSAEGLAAVEIQRDLDWKDVPADVVKAAEAPFTPARVIESRQVEDGSVIYELFQPDQPTEPAIEVQVTGGVAKRLTERSVY